MKRSFWGNFPLFLIPQTNKPVFFERKKRQGETYPSERTKKYRNRKIDKWLRAKIPIPISRALGRAARNQKNYSYISLCSSQAV